MTTVFLLCMNQRYLSHSVFWQMASKLPHLTAAQMSASQGIRYRISSVLGKTLIRILEIPIGIVVPQRAMFNPEEFGWAENLERLWPDIQREYQEIASVPETLPDIRDISVEQQPVIEAQRWVFFPLKLYGVPLPKQLAACPVTAKAIASIPHCTTAFFSVLKPGARIKPHRGAFKGYLRLHLGVVVPDEAHLCGLRIGNDIFHWEEGSSLIFDDTFIHDAFNDADTERVVLYIDFIRPMPAVLLWLSKGLTWLVSRSAYVQGSIHNLRMHRPG